MVFAESSPANEAWDADMKLTKCRSLIRRPKRMVWYRAIQPEFCETSLATTQTTVVASRFSSATENEPAFPVLYLSENHQVALVEVGALFGSPLMGTYVPNPRRSWVLLNVQVTLQEVADLTDPGEHSKLQTSAQELTGDWECYEYRPLVSSFPQPAALAPTQLLGAALDA